MPTRPRRSMRRQPRPSMREARPGQNAVAPCTRTPRPSQPANTRPLRDHLCAVAVINRAATSYAPHPAAACRSGDALCVHNSGRLWTPKSPPPRQVMRWVHAGGGRSDPEPDRQHRAWQARGDRKRRIGNARDQLCERRGAADPATVYASAGARSRIAGRARDRSCVVATTPPDWI